MDKGTAQFIVWKPEYSVRDEVLDSQHRKMFDIISTTYSQMRSGLSNEEIHRLLEEARAYAKKHFQAEEDAMRNCGYPEFDAHQRVHRKYEYEVQSLIRRQAQPARALPYDLLSFLKEWWKEHVTDMDQRYAPFLRSRNEENKADESDS